MYDNCRLSKLIVWVDVLCRRQWCRDWLTVCEWMCCAEDSGAETGLQCVSGCVVQKTVVQRLAYSVWVDVLCRRQWCRDWLTVCEWMCCAEDSGAETGVQCVSECVVQKTVVQRLAYSVWVDVLCRRQWCRDWLAGIVGTWSVFRAWWSPASQRLPMTRPGPLTGTSFWHAFRWDGEL